MSILQNDVFKMVNLRGPDLGLAIDPTGTDPDSTTIVERLADVEVDLRNPSARVLEDIADVPILGRSELRAYPLTSVLEALRPLLAEFPANAGSVTLECRGDDVNLMSVLGHPSFRDDYRGLDNDNAPYATGSVRFGSPLAGSSSDRSGRSWGARQRPASLRRPQGIPTYHAHG